MSDKTIDVVTVMKDAAIRLDVSFPNTAKELREACATAEELIEAGKEYRNAMAACDADDHGARKVYERAEAARFRFVLALDRATGATQ